MGPLQATPRKAGEGEAAKGKEEKQKGKGKEDMPKLALEAGADGPKAKSKSKGGENGTSQPTANGSGGRVNASSPKAEADSVKSAAPASPPITPKKSATAPPSTAPPHGTAGGKIKRKGAGGSPPKPRLSKLTHANTYEPREPRPEHLYGWVTFAGDGQVRLEMLLLEHVKASCHAHYTAVHLMQAPFQS